MGVGGGHEAVDEIAVDERVWAFGLWTLGCGETRPLPNPVRPVGNVRKRSDERLHGEPVEPVDKGGHRHIGKCEVIAGKPRRVRQMIFHAREHGPEDGDRSDDGCVIDLTGCGNTLAGYSPVVVAMVRARFRLARQWRVRAWAAGCDRSDKGEGPVECP